MFEKLFSFSEPCARMTQARARGSSINRQSSGCARDRSLESALRVWLCYSIVPGDRGSGGDYVPRELRSSLFVAGALLLGRDIRTRFIPITA